MQSRAKIVIIGNEFELRVSGEPRRAVIVEQCVYDPQNLLPRAEG